ncbi:hypothetical protein G6O69_16745 [Pseudenhygromyxa sp. WMMC2535]|uniref:DUF6531 domain-containing protein n=1 Tax=Pseudenhygromyxa sp. WMMC2535 TaxID=2712867 RepID=UPI0015549FB5|nr:DUF6531 domain-containing protein [Pseudenhygromyxa sp. WMMC2535]NVB39493.1 hypothetical protein [Pseudenhygromyxa sp. WMMC2535]
MIASSFMDPVLGLDVHFEMVPMPAPVPTPIPNPFIGIVFDPIGLACGIALGAAIGAVVGAPFQGPVLYWTAFPATNTGTEAKHIPGHILIPPGTMWAPFPKAPKPVIHPGETPTPGLPVKPENDAIVVFGSKTVSVMGSNAVRLGDIALSCSEPLRLPSSVVLAVPKGAPILIGGPPSLDLMAAVMASLRTRFVSDSLHALVSRLKPSRFRNFLHKAVCFFTGHPVDVASGKVVTSFVDAELPGPLPLTIERHYSSAFAAREGPLGHGWSLSLDQAIWAERGKLVLLAEDGREIEFDTFDFPHHRLAPGHEVYNPIERLRLRCMQDGAWELRDHAGLVREFAPVDGRADGRAMIRVIRSRCGFHEIQFRYDPRGRLEWVRDSSERWIRINYYEHGHEQGRVREIDLLRPHAEGHERHRSFHYDAAGDLVEVGDSLGNRWQFEYVTHLLTRERDRTGLSFYFAYDGLGEDAWCVRTWGDGGIFDHVISYDKRKRATFVTNSRGLTTQYHMNLVGQVVEIVDPLGAKTCYEYDAVSLQRTRVVDALGGETLIRHDTRGNEVHRRQPDGGEVEVEYDERGLPRRMMTEIGAQWTWERDRHGRLTIERAPDGSERRFFYERGLLVGIIDERGAQRAIGYSDQRLPSSLRAAGVVLERWDHDRLGRPVRRSDSRGVVRRQRYNSEGWLVEVAARDGSHARLDYDGEGRVIAIHDDAGETRFVLQGRGRVRARRRGQAEVHYEYDSEARLTGIRDAEGRTYRFELDERGLVSVERDFEGREHRYVRDALGRVVEHHAPGRRKTEYEYDACGRPTQVRDGDGEATRYVYRADGALIEATNSARAIELERDELGRILCERQDDVRVESRYDSGGLRVAVRSSQAVASELSRDALGNVTGVAVETRAGAWAMSFAHDGEGAELGRRLPGDVQLQWARDPSGRPERHVSWSPRGIIHDVRYTWGAGSRLTVLTDDRRAPVEFSHDDEGNLVRCEGPEGSTRWRARDRVGNLYRSEDRRERKYGARGQTLVALAAEGATRYEYDDEGRLIAKHTPDGASWRYRYSGAGRLREVERPDGEVVRFAYDAFGRRVSQAGSLGERTWYWDGHALLHEVDNDGLVTWISDADGIAPLARVSGDEFMAVVVDHRGAPRAMFDAAGELRWEGRMDTEGALELGQGDPSLCPFRHAGQYHDAATGLSYNRFRYYDPELGHYITPDPIRCIGGLVLGSYVRSGDVGPHHLDELHGSTSLYAYVGDPLVWVDPFGLVRIHTQNGVAVNAFAGPAAGGIEHAPLHAHVVENGNREVRVLMEDWIDNGRFKGAMGDVYPGDPALSKRARKVISKNLDDLARKTREVFETGGCS